MYLITFGSPQKLIWETIIQTNLYILLLRDFEVQWKVKHMKEKHISDIFDMKDNYRQWYHIYTYYIYMFYIQFSWWYKAYFFFHKRAKTNTSCLVCLEVLIFLFSSPETKAQMSFSDKDLFVVCRCRCQWCWWCLRFNISFF